MSKTQRGNKEAKKPKQAPSAAKPAVSPFAIPTAAARAVQTPKAGKR